MDRYGPAALGLQRVEGAPKDAAPGTILVLYGGTMNIDKDYGDISIIGGKDKRGNLICYNDGTMVLPPDGAASVLRGMYQPVDRPALTPVPPGP